MEFLNLMVLMLLAVGVLFLVVDMGVILLLLRLLVFLDVILLILRLLVFLDVMVVVLLLRFLLLVDLALATADDVVQYSEVECCHCGKGPLTPGHRGGHDRLPDPLHH